MTTQETHFQRLFDDFNTCYFDGRLPSYRVRVLARIGGLCHAGQIDRRERNIDLLNNGDTKMMIATLLHEMAHAAANDYHGARWRGELARLQALGAPIHPADLDPRLPITKAFVRSTAHDALIDDPTVSEERFVRWFAQEHLAMTPAQATRRYWWMGSAFADARCEYESRIESATKFQHLIDDGTPC